MKVKSHLQVVLLAVATHSSAEGRKIFSEQGDLKAVTHTHINIRVLC